MAEHRTLANFTAIASQSSRNSRLLTTLLPDSFHSEGYLTKPLLSNCAFSIPRSTFGNVLGRHDPHLTSHGISTTLTLSLGTRDPGKSISIWTNLSRLIEAIGSHHSAHACWPLRVYRLVRSSTSERASRHMNQCLSAHDWKPPC